MKRILLVAMALFFAMPNMQAKGGEEEQAKIVLVKEDGSDNYYYEGVVPVEGVTKEEMFRRAKEWVLTRFKTIDNNMQFDEANYSIINSAVISIKETSVTWPAVASFKVSLKFKDGKYKYRFENVWIQPQLLQPTPAVPYGRGDVIINKKNTAYINYEINKALASLATQLDAAIKGANDKDW